MREKLAEKNTIHDDLRKEIELKFDHDQFEKLEKLFLASGYEVEIKWFRKRLEFKEGYGRFLFVIASIVRRSVAISYSVG